MSKNKMDLENYYTLAGIVFTFAFLVHGTRVLNGWDMFLGSWLIPMWVSYLAVILTAYLAYHSYSLRK